MNIARSVSVSRKFVGILFVDNWKLFSINSFTLSNPQFEKKGNVDQYIKDVRNKVGKLKTLSLYQNFGKILQRLRLSAKCFLFHRWQHDNPKLMFLHWVPLHKTAVVYPWIYYWDYWDLYNTSMVNYSRNLKTFWEEVWN